MPAEQILVCPTCNAEQAWSDTCRRCKCDLELYIRSLQLREELHQMCLRAIHRGDMQQAISRARKLWELSPDQDSARLLAVCMASIGRMSVVEQLLAAHDDE